MKIIKFILKFILTPILVLLVGILVFFTIKNTLYLGTENPGNIAYLKAHNEVLDRSNLDFKSFDSAFYNNNIFILSENHGYEDVQTIDYALLIHLNKKIGLRYYIAETDSNNANRLNSFLRNATPDVNLLKEFVKNIALGIPQQSSQQLFDKWMRIHAYNTRLKDNAKIEILGLDQNYDDKTTKLSRDSSMLLNLKYYLETKHLEKEKFYGLFGYYHSLQSSVNENNRFPFAAKLKRYAAYPPFQKVQSITTYTLESEMYMPKMEGMPTPPDNKLTMFNIDGPIALVRGVKDLKATSQPNSLTLYHLDAENSPYKKSQNLAGVNVNFIGDKVVPNNSTQVTTDFFQHIILLRGSKSLSPLK